MPPSETTGAVDFKGKILNNVEVQDCVNQLRNLITADTKYGWRTDDAFLLRYLHATGFKVEDAHKRLQKYYEHFLEHPDWFAHQPPENHLELFNKYTKFILQDRDRHGRRIFLVKLGNLDASKTNPAEVSQTDDMWFETVLDEPETQAKGICVIVDMAGYSWKLFRWLTPGNIRIGSKKTDLMPVKQFQFHVVNSSMLLNAAVTILFPFLSAKIKDQIHFHFEDWPSLHKFVDPSVLPPEYGGSRPLDCENLTKWLFDQKPQLEEKLKYNRIKS